MPGTAYKVAYVEVSLLKEEPKPEEKLQVPSRLLDLPRLWFCA
jgi:hypothetical protein